VQLLLSPKPTRWILLQHPYRRTKSRILRSVKYVGSTVRGRCFYVDRKRLSFAFLHALFSVPFILSDSLPAHWSLLAGLEKIIAQRERPSNIYCDNGTKTVGSEGSLQRMDMDLVFKYNSAQRIVCKFNPPVAPWWGQWWGRLIRVIKQLLKIALRRVRLSYKDLATDLCDYETVLNARTLTYMPYGGPHLTPSTPSLFSPICPGLGSTGLWLLEWKKRYRECWGFCRICTRTQDSVFVRNILGCLCIVES
jgi:hypothetical protein